MKRVSCVTFFAFYLILFSQLYTSIGLADVMFSAGDDEADDAKINRGADDEKVIKRYDNKAYGNNNDEGHDNDKGRGDDVHRQCIL